MLASRARLALASALLAALAASSMSCVLITEIDYDLIPEPTTGAGGSTPACEDDAACDDASPCTEDRCESGACTHTPLPAGTSCGAGMACSTTVTCDGQGACVEAQVVVDDGNACTVDACDPGTGEVSHTSAGGACLDWAPLPTENAPAARYNHTAIWTGSKMIVWGGERAGADPLLGDGAIYDPETRTWSPMSMTNAPAARFGHTAVWTGTHMIVWGGYTTNGFGGGGGMYNPTTDTWYPIESAGEPAARIRHSAVWTGSQMIVWGGTSANNKALNSGGRYDPVTNTWSSMATSGGPSVRTQHSATWTGDRMVVWGGMDFFDWLGDGAMYSPLSDQWVAKTTALNAPSFRESHSAVWTGERLIVWGGWNGGPYLDTGAAFDPQASQQGGWTPLPTEGAPSARRDHVAVWTGSAMFVWGGCGDLICTGSLGDGGRFTPDANGGAWDPVPEVPTLSSRRNATAVWTGKKIVVFGGRDASGALGTGADVAP